GSGGAGAGRGGGTTRGDAPLAAFSEKAPAGGAPGPAATAGDDRNLSREFLTHASERVIKSHDWPRMQAWTLPATRRGAAPPKRQGAQHSVDPFDPVQDRAMHQPPRIRTVGDHPMHHAAVVPDEDVAELPFVPVDDLPARRMAAQLLDERAALGVGHSRDMVHGHAEDERLASGLVPPDERMLLHADASCTTALRFGGAPACQLLGRGVRVG